jgi:hypothetical protein
MKPGYEISNQKCHTINAMEISNLSSPEKMSLATIKFKLMMIMAHNMGGMIATEYLQG